MSMIKCLLLPEPWYWYSSAKFTRIAREQYNEQELNLRPILGIYEDDNHLLVYSIRENEGWFKGYDQRKFPTKEEAMLWVETMIATGAAGDGNPLG